MTETYLTTDECQVLLAVITRSYQYKEDDEAAEFMSDYVKGVIPRDIIESLKKRKILGGYGDEMSVLYEYYMSAITQGDLESKFLDFKNPSQNELALFELEYQVEYNNNKIGQYVYDKSDI
jgi:hypothetical protein